MWTFGPATIVHTEPGLALKDTERPEEAMALTGKLASP